MLRLQSSIIQNKKEVRKVLKSLRQELFDQNKIPKISNEIVQNILNCDFFKSAKHILIFYPLPQEVDLLGLLECRDKIFYFPKCDGEKLLICPNDGNFDVNKYGIKEPKTKPLKDLSLLDLLFVPALGVDKDFIRIGYGGGYYDRFFANNNLKATKIAVVADELLCEKLPSEKFDAKCDIIVTQKMVIL